VDPKKALWTVFLVAMLVRIGFFSVTRIHGKSTMMGLGEALVAEGLLEGHGFSRDINKLDFIDDLVRNKINSKRVEFDTIKYEGTKDFRPVFDHPPGYALVLASTFWLSGERKFVYSVLLQILLDSAAAVLVALLAAQLFNSQVGIISGYLYAFWLPIISLTTRNYPDAYVPFLVIGGTLLFVNGVQTGRKRCFLLSGVVLGGGALFRPEMIVLPLIFVATGWLLWRGRSHWAWSSSLLLVSSILVIMPWIGRNYKWTGEILLTTSFGPTLWQGLGEHSNPWGISHSDEVTANYARAQGFRSHWDPDAHRHFMRKFLEHVREDPKSILVKMIKNIPRDLVLLPQWCCELSSFLPGIYGRENSYREFRKRGGELGGYIRTYPFHVVVRVFTYLVRWTFNGLMFFSIFYFFLFVKNGGARRRMLFLLVIPLFFLIVHMPFPSDYRYQVPGQFAYLIFFALVSALLLNKEKSS
jgi:4-amino-4-deoxy-L-arabinose transferase-like glycosyltransferase